MPEAPMSRMSGSSEGQPCRNVSVLVVEHHEESRAALVSALQNVGAHVMSVSTVAEALVCMRTVKPDVLVSELVMPDQDGFALLKHVQSSPDLNDIPAIAVAGHGDLMDAANRSGFHGFVKNPVNADELWHAVRALVQGHRESAQ